MGRSLGIIIGDKSPAFLPEVSAYQTFFEGRGFDVTVHRGTIRDSPDYAILMFGLFPPWREPLRGLSPKARLIGEYHSVGTGRAARLKTMLKRVANARCDYYVFLNPWVRRNLGFCESERTTYRPMGFDPEARDAALGMEKTFDFVYAGSVFRTGAPKAIISLAIRGYSGLIVGCTEAEFLSRTGEASAGLKNLRFAGRLQPRDVYPAMSSARFGLNFTENRYPYSHQDSTKVIEYVSLGLPVVSNSYSWVNWFGGKYGVSITDLAEFMESGVFRRDAPGQQAGRASIEDLAWPKLITASKLPDWLECPDPD